MSAKRLSDKWKTWIEIDASAIRHNCRVFRGLIGGRVKLWSVVKSNAYGHGLMAFSKVAARAGADGFCVDSVVEGLTLRREGIRKPILVLGPTLPRLLSPAAAEGVTISISNFGALKALRAASRPPYFHLKIDTGMHRQGFYPSDVPKAARFVSGDANLRARCTGVFTHFASAKDVNYPTYTDRQLELFERSVALLTHAGLTRLTAHASATGGTLIGKKYHLDAVRVGIGLYGLFPSRELQIQLPNLRLTPVLSWRAVVSEIKRLRRGDYVGYDLAERIPRSATAAVIPIGYWHGFPRSLSHVGEVLVRGRRARVLGRVSMDLVTLDVTGVPCAVGDVVTVIGRDRREHLGAGEAAQRSHTIHYEFLTRLNPLIERVVV